MSDQFHILPGVVPPVTSTTGQRIPAGGRKGDGPSFAEVLDRQNRPIQFSRHAQQRMASRGISFNADEMQRLGQAVAAVDAKGAKDSLVLLGSNALVVSVKNQTVVTVVGQDSLKDNVFTNIDSAIIA